MIEHIESVSNDNTVQELIDTTTIYEFTNHKFTKNKLRNIMAMDGSVNKSIKYNKNYVKYVKEFLIKYKNFKENNDIFVLSIYNNV